MGGQLPDSTVVTLEHAAAASSATRQPANLPGRVIKIERPGSANVARQHDEATNGMSSRLDWLNRPT
jgi:crotonobetainyl-CoA:carnitine CoA-transferase CaiB-like acyl-CoA transferase